MIRYGVRQAALHCRRVVGLARIHRVAVCEDVGVAGVGSG